MSQGVCALLRFARTTRDLRRAVTFYCDALACAVDAADAPPPAWTRLPGLRNAPRRCARLSLGKQPVDLLEQADVPPRPPNSTGADLGFQHFAIVVSDIDAAYERVMDHGATPIGRGGPQALPPATGCVRAFKFRDPDGNPLELLWLPPGTGDPAWQAGHDRLFLGIDHSAISVAAAADSIAFYQSLGWRVAATGINRGVEQERLDDLAGVVVDVVTMEALARTPHLELLGYRTPRGRAGSASATGADCLVCGAQGVEVMLGVLHQHGRAGTIVAQGEVGGLPAAVLRDPDGHRLALVEQG